MPRLRWNELGWALRTAPGPMEALGFLRLSLQVGGKLPQKWGEEGSRGWEPGRA